MKDVVSTLENWCNGCDELLSCLESQADRANDAKSTSREHRKHMEQRVRHARIDLGLPPDPPKPPAPKPAAVLERPIRTKYFGKIAETSF